MFRDHDGVGTRNSLIRTHLSRLALFRVMAVVGILVGALFFFQNSASASYHMVTPNGTGNNSGTDWDNAMVGNTVLHGGSLIRGDVYCIGGGTYNNWVLTQAASGATIIELRAATPSDASCGSAIAGWSSTVDTTQNPAVVTKGSLPVNSGSCMVYVQSSYWFFNGVSRTGLKGTYNFILDNAWPNYVGNVLCGSGFGYQNSGIHVAYLKFLGGGIHEDATETATIASTSGSGTVASVTINPNCSKGNRCIMPWFTNQYVTITGNGAYNCAACQILSVSGNTFTYASSATGNVTTGTVQGVISQNEEQLVLTGNSTTHTVGNEVAYSYFVNTENSPFQGQNIENSSYHDNIFGAQAGTPPDHGNDISQDSTTNVSIYRNVFEDCESTACLNTGVNHGTDVNLAIYDNIAITHAGNPYHQEGTGNGFFSTTTTGGVNGLYVYNNTIINMSGTISNQAGIVYNNSVAATNCYIRNNLVYGNGVSIVGALALGCVEDHNTAIFVPTNTLFKAASDAVTSTDVSGSLFENWRGTCSSPGGTVPVCAGENYALISEPSQVANRVSLGTPYDRDFTGAVFTSSRGSYQLGSTGTTGPTPPEPPAGLTAAVN